MLKNKRIRNWLIAVVAAAIIIPLALPAVSAAGATLPGQVTVINPVGEVVSGLVKYAV